MTAVEGDPYKLVEDGFVAKMRAKVSELAEFDYQVASDDTVIARGADYFLVYRPGAFPTDDVDEDQDDFTWHINCDLFIRYKEYQTSWDIFKVVRWKIIKAVRSDRSLGSIAGVYKTRITSPEQPQYFALEEKAVKPNFIIQGFQVEVTQRVEFEEE